MVIHDIAKFATKVLNENYDTMVYMDKSARPLHTLLHTTLRTLGEDTPETRFLDPWISNDMKFSNAQISESSIEYVRNTYRPRNNTSFGKMLIVDELSAAGTTLAVAKELFEKAFQDTNYAPSDIEATDVLAMYPRWYSKQEHIGIIPENDLRDKEITELSRQQNPPKEEIQDSKEKLKKICQ